ncbi:GAP family protein [Mycolicibacterium grossiae]|uniref:GAP family protein n=1 Tax=Mycolicibacterium grossiae TaxID=1552759 RepID=A0A1E8Q3I0_9MYCO|nr:GAP family protein [Mycolicibacterium grossiae]OFJ53143.1 hypothetical protein BEL07_14030 [Mycolicibacterium grossiae]QEM44745.1 GAP family protein [Mycolicibacterium grossiae]
MWITLLVMAVAVSLEPFRIGLAVLVLNRPRPVLQMLAFLSGGYAMGLTVGVLILFVLHPRLPGASEFSLPTVQLVIGGVCLACAVLLAAQVLLRRRRGLPTPVPDQGPGRFAGLSRRLVEGRRLWVSAVAGLGIALPSVDYLAVLAVILTFGESAAVQFGALLVFHVVAFALVEIPLVAYLFAPDRTLRALTALNDWIRSRRRIDVAGLLAVFGGVLMGVGLAGI